MSWSSFHHRGEILRAVVDAANERLDGVVPADVPGVADHFVDDLDLVGALMLKWHARLSGNIERALAREPLDLVTAVSTAWHTTAKEMAGVRMVIDRCAQQPATVAMEQAMMRARSMEWARLAVAAGLASSRDSSAEAAGRRVEALARKGLLEPVPAVSFVDWLRAALAA